MFRFVFALAAVAATSGSAYADRCIMVPITRDQLTVDPAALNEVSNVLFLDRCPGGCRVIGASRNNARSLESSIPPPGTYDFPAFAGRDAIPGNADDDDEWQKIVDCAREVYSYYDIEVTDQLPASGTFHRSIVSNVGPEVIGLPGNTLGISPFLCEGADNVMSFAFVKNHSSADSADFVKRVCWTITHEAGHAYTLEHTFHWLDDGTPGCDDVMSYDDQNCHPIRYFRDRASNCGGFMQEPCKCATAQNPHRKLLALHGAGNPTVPAGHASISNPTSGASLGAVIIAAAGDKRQINKIELRVNGHKWAEQPGAHSGPLGQPDPSMYVFTVPTKLPHGVVDLFVRAHDDLGYVDSSIVTATYGEPCTSADTCLERQMCNEGRCEWDVSGAFGDTCTDNEFCESGLCMGTADTKICTQDCLTVDPSTCPDGYVCEATNGDRGVCFFATDGGCCSAGHDRPWSSVLASLGVGVLLLRPRRIRSRS